jgi:hypothetical protein
VIALSLKHRGLPPPRRAGLSPEQAEKLPPWHSELFQIEESIIEEICSAISKQVDDDNHPRDIINALASQIRTNNNNSVSSQKRTSGPSSVPDTKKAAPHRSNIVHDALAPSSGRSRPTINSANGMVTDSVARNRTVPTRNPPTSSSTHSPRGRDGAWTPIQSKPPPSVRPTSPSSPPPIHPTSPMDTSGSSRWTGSGSRKRAHSPEVQTSNSRSRSISPISLERSEEFKKTGPRTFHNQHHHDKPLNAHDERKEGFSHSRENIRVIVAREPVAEKNVMKRESTSSRVFDMKMSQAEADSDELEEGEIRIVEEKEEFLYRNAGISSDVH